VLLKKNITKEIKKISATKNLTNSKSFQKQVGFYLIFTLRNTLKNICSNNRENFSFTIKNHETGL